MAAIKSPQQFFQALPPTHRFQGSILILTAVSMLSGFIAYPFYGALMMFMFPVVWIVLVSGLLMWSHFLSWGIRTFSASRLVPSNAFAISAHASVPLVLGFIPWLGALALLYSLYLMWVGIVERGRISSGLAIGLLSVPILLLLVVALVLIDTLPQLAAVI